MIIRRLPPGSKGGRTFIERALFEPSTQDRLRELVRPSVDLRPPHPMKPDGASMVLGPFAETKGPRLPGRNPATQNITLIRELGPHVRCLHLPAFFLLANPKIDSRYTSYSCKARTINSICSRKRESEVELGIVRLSYIHKLMQENSSFRAAWERKFIHASLGLLM